VRREAAVPRRHDLGARRDGAAKSTPKASTRPAMFGSNAIKISRRFATSAASSRRPAHIAGVSERLRR